MPYDNTAELPEVIDGLGRAFQEFKSAQDARLDEIEKKLGRARFQSALAGSEGTGDLVEAKSNLASFLRHGEVKASGSMRVGSDPAGGYVVDAALSRAITATIKEQSPIRQAGARVEVIDQADAFEEIVDRDDAEAVWMDETSPRAATKTPDLALLRIPTFELSAEPRATQQLLEDANRDLSSWLIGKVADSFAQKENAAFVAGTGVGQPRGFLSYPTSTAGDSTRTWGTIQYVPTGVNGDFAASNPADVLYDLMGTMKAGYKSGAVWLAPREVITKVRKFKDTSGQYIWQPGLQAGAPDLLLGHPVFETPDMPALANGSLSMAFANLTRGYCVVDRLAVQTLRDPFTARPFVVFATRRRVGGAVINSEAIKLLKFAAS